MIIFNWKFDGKKIEVNLMPKRKTFSPILLIVINLSG